MTLERYLELEEKGFKFAGQSYLFWEYVRVLEEVRKVNPNVLFLLENVRMLSKWEDVINRTLGVKGVHINSALVSAQIRKRIYWTNISDIPQPEDKGIFLRDILQSSVPEKYYLSDRATIWLNRHADKLGHKVVVKGGGDKSNCITVSGLTKSNLATCYVEVPEEHYLEDVDISELEECLKGTIPPVCEGCLLQRMVSDRTEGTKKKSGLGELKTILFETAEKTGTLLTSASSVPALLIKRRLRRITPTEAARLQTVPDWYKWECSDTQQYKMLGNGWTVAVIYHIFSFIK